MTWAALVAAALVGYAAGAASPAALLARARRVDLRGHGSGNPGATNVGRVFGVRWGVLVASADVMKGLLPAAAFGVAGEGPAMVAGAAAVVGHVSSPFLRGRGGKGVATSFGAVLGVEPIWAAVVLAVFLAVWAASRWVALASMSSAVALVIVSQLATDDLTVQVWAGFLALVILWRHRANVVSRWRAWRVYR